MSGEFITNGVFLSNADFIKKEETRAAEDFKSTEEKSIILPFTMAGKLSTRIKNYRPTNNVRSS